MPTPSNSVTFWAVPYGTSSTVAVGNVMIPTTDATAWLVSTTAARGTRRSEGIAVTSYGGSGIGTVEIWQVGTIDATISGLAAGSASWVRCSATGTIERVTPATGDDIIGYAEADGRVHLAFGFLTAAIVSGASPTLTTPTLVSPIITGTPRYSGTRGDVQTVTVEVQTSSVTQTTGSTFTMANETLCAFDVIVTCARRTNVTKGGRYKRSVVYRRTGGGAPTIVGTLESGTDQETTAGDDITIDVSSNDVRVRVTAADTDPRNWYCEMRVQETLAT